MIDALLKEQESILERAQPFIEDRTLVRNIIADGCERARETADETMEQMRSVMNLDYY